MKFDRKKYNQSEKRKAVEKKYRHSEKGIAVKNKADKKYRESNKGKIVAKNGAMRHNKKYPERKKAISVVNNAVAKKTLIKEPCEFCGIDYDVQGHHHNYEQPLNVMWLCRICHKVLHGVI